MNSPNAFPKRRRSWAPVVIAVLAVLALIGGFFAVRAVGRTAGPATPAAPGLTVGTGTVTATWPAVEGARSYQLRRGDEIVYSGTDTRATDTTVTKGTRKYTVVAVGDDGILSHPSASASIDAGPGWGLYAPLIAQLPKLLPQAPDQTGWNGISCVWMLKPATNERGPSESGAGEVWTKLRIRCASSGFDTAMQVMWFDDKDGLDGALGTIAQGGQAFRWAHGTGYYLTGADTGHAILRLDEPGLDNILIGVADGLRPLSNDQLLAMSNSLPI